MDYVLHRSTFVLRRVTKRDTLAFMKHAKRAEDAAQRKEWLAESRYGPLPAVQEVPMQQISIRMPVADLDRAREIAKGRGVQYHALLRRAMQLGLDHFAEAAE